MFVLLAQCFLVEHKVCQAFYHMEIVKSLCAIVHHVGVYVVAMGG